MMLGSSRVHHRPQQQSYSGGLSLHQLQSTPAAAASAVSTKTVPRGASRTPSPIKDVYDDLSRSGSSLTSRSSTSDVVIVTNDKSSKFDQLHAVRYKLEHNQLRAVQSDKVGVFKILNKHLSSADWEVKQFAVQLVHDILPHVGDESLDNCMAEVIGNLIPCLGNTAISVRKAAVQAVQVYLRFTADIAFVFKAIVNFGLEHPDQTVVNETLISIPLLFTSTNHQKFDDHQQGFIALVGGLAKKLAGEDTRLPAFMSLQRLADVVGVKQFQVYLNKLTGDQKRIYDELATIRSTKHSLKLNNNDLLESEDNMNCGLVMIHGRKMSTGNGLPMTSVAANSNWFEYGAIDDSIIEKLRDEEDVRVRLSGADELNRAVKTMKDLTPLLPQMRLFLTFLDSVLEGEINFKMVLLVLETYGVLIDRMRHKVKPHLRSLCSALLRHASNAKIVVRIENYRVIKKLMLVAKPNIVLNNFFDHLGDKRSMVREDVLNIVMYALLTFPSNEFDLKNIAATVVPTLVDPKRRVRQASQECVAILAAFMGPSKAAPLIRSIELLESHFERGNGVLNAVQARLSRRQLPRITQDGLVEYSLQVPRSAIAYANNHYNGQRSGSPIKKYGADIDWILAGTGSISSGSAKSVSMCRSESRLDESFSSSATASYPNSPITQRKSSPSSGQQNAAVSVNGTSFYPKRSRSEEFNSNAVGEKRHEKKLPNLNEAAASGNAGKASAGGHGSSSGGAIAAAAGGGGKSARHKFNANAGTSEAELPRLTGTKSQASTASSSATRDSGISVNDVQKATASASAVEEALLLTSSSSSKIQSRRQSKVGQKSRTGSSRSNISIASHNTRKMISVDDLPVSGKAMPLGKRPGTNRSSLSNFDSGNESKSSSSTTMGAARIKSVTNAEFENRPSVTALTRSISGSNPSTNGFIKRSSLSQDAADDVTPPRSPLLVSKPSLLLRPADNSPFTTTSVHYGLCNQSNGASSTNSTPYSQISVPSSYDYEDDFTSESESEMSFLPTAVHNSLASFSNNSGMVQPAAPLIPNQQQTLTSAASGDKLSAHSQRTVKSTNSSSSSSRIPIKRNSSLRRKNYRSTSSGGEEEPQTLVIEDHHVLVPPSNSRTSMPLSQAEFDDMPIHVASRNFQVNEHPEAAATNVEQLPAAAQTQSSSKKAITTVVQKRPFLQRRSSPNKIINKNNNQVTASTTAGSSSSGSAAAKPKSSRSNFARSPPSKQRAIHSRLTSSSKSPDKRPSASNISSTKVANSSKTPSLQRTSNFSIRSSLHKSTPNLAAQVVNNSRIPSTTSTPQLPPSGPTNLEAMTRSSSHGRTPPQSSGSASDETNNLIDAVPAFSTASKLARTPPQMTRKIVALPATEATEATAADQEDCQQLDQPLDNGLVQDNECSENDLGMIEEPAAAVVESSAASGRGGPSVTAAASATSNGHASSISSAVSVANLHYLPLKTQITLKSPLEGHNLGPFHRPEEFLHRTLDNLNSDDWEVNVNGMAAVVRFARHHPEYLLVEYKPLLQLVMKHVKNLRSQVCRTAVMVVGELFTHLKRNMEPELEKVMLPLILKSGDTNKFLREDCKVSLDAIVENSSPSKIILIVTAELVYHKSPVVRTSVSRLLAYTVERMGVHKALAGGKDITDKLLPAIAKLAQDGSPDARNYAKSCLHRMLSEHADFEKILKKSLTPNTMRNLDKIIEALKNPSTSSNGLRTRSRGNRATATGRSRKTL